MNTKKLVRSQRISKKSDSKSNIFTVRPEPEEHANVEQCMRMLGTGAKSKTVLEVCRRYPGLIKDLENARKDIEALRNKMMLYARSAHFLMEGMKGLEELIAPSDQATRPVGKE